MPTTCIVSLGISMTQRILLLWEAICLGFMMNEQSYSIYLVTLDFNTEDEPEEREARHHNHPETSNM